MYTDVPRHWYPFWLINCHAKTIRLVGRIRAKRQDGRCGGSSFGRERQDMRAGDRIWLYLDRVYLSPFLSTKWRVKQEAAGSKKLGKMRNRL